MSGDLVPSSAAGDVGIQAVALAAARLALEERARSHAPPNAPAMTRAEVEAAAEQAVRDALLLLGIDLKSPESLERFRDTLTNARKVHGWLDKAGSTVWTGVWTAIAGLMIAAVARYVTLGGGK